MTGKNANEDMPSLRHPSCTGENATRDFLININEHPHIRLMITSKNQEKLSIFFSEIILKEQSKKHFIKCQP